MHVEMLKIIHGILEMMYSLLVNLQVYQILLISFHLFCSRQVTKREMDREIKRERIRPSSLIVSIGSSMEHACLFT